MSDTIGIAGMGWLGIPLANHLKNLGFNIKGSVTSTEKAAQLHANDFDVYKVEISEEGIFGEISSFLKNVDCLIILIPPGLRKNKGADHVLKMVFLKEAIENAALQNVILISTTSVYDDSQGNVTEKDLPKPVTTAGKQLLQVEQLFFTATAFKTTIIRFGGLFGGSRNPVKYLAGRKNLNDGNAPVNLIHRKDCIQIISEVIMQNCFGHIFNAVNPNHPLKKEYYSQKAEELGLVPPAFKQDNSENIHKKVDSENLGPLLNYSFLVSV